MPFSFSCSKMRFVAILISLLVVARACAFSPAIYGEFRNTLPFTVTVELANRSGSVYHRLTSQREASVILQSQTGSPVYSIQRATELPSARRPSLAKRHSSTLSTGGSITRSASEKLSLSPFLRDEIGQSRADEKRRY